ncbi:unnamed protein product, partial [marine sediment metagenome]
MISKTPPKKIAVMTVSSPRPMVINSTGTQAIVGTEIRKLKTGENIS